MSDEPALPLPGSTNPWAMLGYLHAELAIVGKITPDAWARAIAKCTTPPKAE